VKGEDEEEAIMKSGVQVIAGRVWKKWRKAFLILAVARPKFAIATFRIWSTAYTWIDIQYPVTLEQATRVQFKPVRYSCAGTPVQFYRSVPWWWPADNCESWEVYRSVWVHYGHPVDLHKRACAYLAGLPEHVFGISRMYGCKCFA
jgi:hypothetical protein